MRLDRREFVVLSALGFVGTLGDRLVFAQAPAQAPAVPEFKDVRRNVGVFTARGGTIGYLVTPDAVVSWTVSSPTRRRCSSKDSSQRRRGRSIS